MHYDFSILYYMDLYKKYWKHIALTVGIAVSLTFLFTLFQPAIYQSTVTILSAERGEATVSSIGRLFGIPATSVNSSSEIIVSILNSRRMKNDIEKRFDLDNKPRFKWEISADDIIGGMDIKVKGSDPKLTHKIADFAVANLDKINDELDITPSKPMVKVLDPAMHGIRQSRQIIRKMFVAAILSFLITTLYCFFSDYIQKLKKG